MDRVKIRKIMERIYHSVDAPPDRLPIAEMVASLRRYNPHGIDAYPDNNRRRTRLCGCTTHHTRQEWENKKKSYNYTCAYCGKQTKLTKDHVIPLSKGGNDNIENIVPSCQSCNSRKYNNYFTNDVQQSQAELTITLENIL